MASSATPTPPPSKRAPHPLPRSALTALDALRKPLSPPALHQTLQTIHASLTTAPALNYTTKRLLHALSPSHNTTRHNATKALTLLSKAHPLPPLLSQIATLYGPKPTFSHDYPGASRERFLALLAALTALLAPAPPLSSDIAVQTLHLLRLLVSPDATRWHLCPAAAKLAVRVVHSADRSGLSPVQKEARRWVDARKSSTDGAHLALALREAALLPDPDFRTIYPAPGSGLFAALLATFATGFSTLPAVPFATRERYMIPAVWTLAMRYVVSPVGTAHLGGLRAVWPRLVDDALVRSRSPEKQLLALSLLPVVAEHIDSQADFDAVFTSALAALIAAVTRARTKTKTDEFLRGAVCDVGEKVLPVFREGDSGDAVMLRSFLMWCVRRGVAKHVLLSTRLHEVLKKLSDHAAGLLLADAVRCIARPVGGEKAGAMEREDVRVAARRRPDLFRFVFALAAARPALAGDVLRVVVLYAVFKEVDGALEGRQKSVVQFEYLVVPDAQRLYGGALPVPSPPLSEQTAAVGFRRLVDSLISSRGERSVAGLPAVCLSIVRDIASAENTSIVTRAGDETAQGSGVLTLAAENASKMKDLAIDETMAPLARALEIMNQFLTLYLYEPHVQDDNRTAHQNTTTGRTLAILFEKLQECIEALTTIEADTEREGVSEMDTEPDTREDEAPHPIEQVTHIIAELCRQDASTFRQIAMMSIEALGPCLDDRVVAVLFDAMDSFLLGNDATESEDEESEDDSDENIGQGQDEEEDNDSGTDAAGEKDDEDGDDLDTMDKNQKEDEDSDSNSDVEIDVNIDIDKEDPAVLAALDKRLGMHMRLLKEDKKAASRRRLQGEFRYTQASRILDIIQAVARILRVRLEKATGSGKLPLVFLDLHVRLYEFAIGQGAINIRFLKQIVSIIERQMLIAPSHISSKVSDSTTALEVADRFYETLKTCSSDRRVSSSEGRIISKSAGHLIGVAALLSPDVRGKVLPAYQEMLHNMLLPGTCFWTPSIFSSFIHKAPVQALQLLPTVLKALESGEMSKQLRASASEVVLALSAAACDLPTTGDNTEEFWASVKSFVMSSCCGSSARKWNTVGYGNMVQVVVNGLKNSSIVNAEELVSSLQTSLDAFPMSRQERKQLLKMITRPGKNKRKLEDSREAASTAEPTAPEPSVTKQAAKKRKKKIR